jgi:hypothetical protein
MGLTMSQRQAVTEAIARNHARRALGQALAPKAVRPGRPRAPNSAAGHLGALGDYRVDAPEDRHPARWAGSRHSARPTSASPAL